MIYEVADTRQLLECPCPLALFGATENGCNTVLLMSFARQHKTGVLLAIRLQPRASRNTIGDVVGDELKIAVTAPPVDSAANEAMIRFLADQLDCPKSAVQLVRGQTSRHKQVIVTGLSLEVVQQRLTPTGKAAH